MCYQGIIYQLFCCSFTLCVATMYCITHSVGNMKNIVSCVLYVLVLCRVWPRQPAEGGGVPDEIRWGLLCHAPIWVLLPGPATQPAELPPQGVRGQVVPHRLERCEWHQPTLSQIRWVISHLDFTEASMSSMKACLCTENGRLAYFPSLAFEEFKLAIE